jgi:hypothetical protein
MGTAVERLTRLVDAPDRFAHSHDDLRDTQIEAMNELFQDRKGRIKLLAARAKEGGVDEVHRLADIVPLLFPHTAYKSYPESFLSEQRWDRLNKWLGTISPHPITPIDTADLADMDAWVDRMGSVGHYLSCSSGTTGKAAVLIASERDMEWTRKDTVGVYSWGAGVKPERDRRMFGVTPVAAVPKNLVVSAAQRDAFCDPRLEAFTFPVPPITIGSQTAMVLLRKAIADGTALPRDIAAFEATSREREAQFEQAYVTTAEALVAARADKLHIMGMWSALYMVAKLVREMGHSGADFHPDNSLYVGGGLKRAQLPPDYQEFVFGTFNIPGTRHFQNYSMQELNSGMPKCGTGNRYHVPPWIIPLILDEEGEELLPVGPDWVVEGRAAFVDLALDGRWNGVITDDKVSLSYGPCACGSAGASIRDDIARYADLKGDDKIGCAGTVDAYVRGLS